MLSAKDCMRESWERCKIKGHVKHLTWRKGKEPENTASSYTGCTQATQNEPYFASMVPFYSGRKAHGLF